MPKAVASPFPTLLLNATEREQIEAAVVTATKTVSLKRPERAQALPGLIAELLVKADLDLVELKTVAVCHRPGSLTGTRIGVTVANTLGWLNGLPIIELNADNLKSALTELKTSHILFKRVATVQNEVVY